MSDEEMTETTTDYQKHFGGFQVYIECEDIIKYLDFNTGTAIKILWDYERKPHPVDELEQALQYIYIVYNMHSKGVLLHTDYYGSMAFMLKVVMHDEQLSYLGYFKYTVITALLTNDYKCAVNEVQDAINHIKEIRTV